MNKRSLCTIFFLIGLTFIAFSSLFSRADYNIEYPGKIYFVTVDDEVYKAYHEEEGLYILKDNGGAKYRVFKSKFFLINLDSINTIRVAVDQLLYGEIKGDKSTLYLDKHTEPSQIDNVHTFKISPRYIGVIERKLDRSGFRYIKVLSKDVKFIAYSKKGLERVKNKLK
ncbi:MAG: hypothetical protein ACQESP_12110 [Candidatus Muiribacteriota bacterium]